MRPAGVPRYGWPNVEGPLSSGPSVPGDAAAYGQLDVRVTVLDVIGMPACVGELSESADVPVAVAE
jgi:hypothetical protein